MLSDEPVPDRARECWESGPGVTDRGTQLGFPLALLLLPFGAPVPEGTRV